MNSDLLVRAVDKAIREGATAAPRLEVFGEDVSYFRTQTDVEIDAAVFDRYLTDLKADADMAAFYGTFANVPSGGVLLELIEMYDASMRGITLALDKGRDTLPIRDLVAWNVDRN
jgi:hypothetical protein